MRPVCSEPLNFHTSNFWKFHRKYFFTEINTPFSSPFHLSTFPAYPRWRNRWISPFDLPCSRSRTPLTSAFTPVQGEQLVNSWWTAHWAEGPLHRGIGGPQNSHDVQDLSGTLRPWKLLAWLSWLSWPSWISWSPTKTSRGRTCQTRSLLLILFSIHLHFQHYGIPLWSKHLKCWELQTWKHKNTSLTNTDVSPKIQILLAWHFVTRTVQTCSDMFRPSSWIAQHVASQLHLPKRGSSPLGWPKSQCDQPQPLRLRRRFVEIQRRVQTCLN